MTVQESEQAFVAGMTVADEEIDAGADVLIPGDMGIGNTTPAAALIGLLGSQDAAAVTGRGTGIDDDTWMRKTVAVRDAMRRGRGGLRQPIELLATVAGPGLRGHHRLHPPVRVPPDPGPARRRHLRCRRHARSPDRLPVGPMVLGRTPVGRARAPVRAQPPRARATSRLPAATRRGQRRPARAAHPASGTGHHGRHGDLRGSRRVYRFRHVTDAFRLAVGTLTALRVPPPRRIERPVAATRHGACPAAGVRPRHRRNGRRPGDRSDHGRC